MNGCFGLGDHEKYSGNRLMSTPQDQEKVLTLSKVDLIRIQRHIVKYSQLFNKCCLAPWYSVTCRQYLSIRASFCWIISLTLNNVAYR